MMSTTLAAAKPPPVARKHENSAMVSAVQEDKDGTRPREGAGINGDRKKCSGIGQTATRVADDTSHRRG